MGDKDLENLISSIGNQEMLEAQKQAQIDRLKNLIKKQKTELNEQQKIIEDLKSKMGNMYDLPADIEELKSMVGSMRADLNMKDQQLEMAYGKVAEMESELKNLKIQMDPLSRNLDTYISQVGELKAKLIEQQSILKLKDKEIDALKMENESKADNLDKMEQEFAKRVQAKLTEFMATEDQYQEKIERMEKEFEEKTTQMQQEYNSKVDQAKGDIHKSREESTQKIRDLETELIDKRFLAEESIHKMELAEKQAQDIKKKFEDLMEKYTIIVKEDQLKADKIAMHDKKTAALIEFKQKNEGIAANMIGLLSLFEEEPLFKTFTLVKDVGSMDLSTLKNSLGIPIVTVKKYIEKFIKADLFDMEGERITLKHTFEV